MVVTFSSKNILNNSAIHFNAQVNQQSSSLKLRPSFSGADKLVVNASKEAVAVAKKSPVTQKALTSLVGYFKKALAFCAATITGAIIVVRNVGDDIKIKTPKVKFKPFKILKDGISRLSNNVGKAVEKTADSGVTDFAGSLIDGASQTVGVDIKKSALSILWNKIRALFGFGS